MKQIFIDEICKILNKEEVRFEEPMAKHTTFQIGGPAQVFVTPHTTEEISKIVRLCKTHEIPLFILGRGSNLLVSDAGMDGVVLKLSDNYADFSIEGNQVRAQAGVLLSKLGYAIS